MIPERIPLPTPLGQSTDLALGFAVRRGLAAAVHRLWRRSPSPHQRPPPPSPPSPPPPPPPPPPRRPQLDDDLSSAEEEALSPLPYHISPRPRLLRAETLRCLRPPHAMPYTIPFHTMCCAVVQPPDGRGGPTAHSPARRHGRMCCVCVSATVHTPARRGGCTGSDPGLTRGMATLNRVCVSAVRVARREHENEASVSRVRGVALHVFELLCSLYVLVCCE